MQLFDDQQQAVVDIRDAFRSHRRVLFTAPTGWGKTVLFCFITRQMYERERPCVILLHRHELLRQVSDTLDQVEVPHGIIGPGPRTWSDDIIQVASVFTLARHTHRVASPYLLVTDEAHHAVPNTTWGKVLGAYPSAFRLGVTATPIRLSGEGLADCFDHMVRGPSVQSLIDRGRLSKFSVYAPPTVDTSGIPVRGGEFVQREVVARVEPAKITGDVIAHWDRHARGLRSLAFCASVEHARAVADAFGAHGVRAQAIWGALGERECGRAVDSFRRGSITVLTSCDLVSEGFDCPAIECGILLRATASTGLYLQQVGRCLRAYPGKDRALILDHVGNTLRHGWPAAAREWTLAGLRASARRDTGSPAGGVRVCKQCWAAAPVSARACPECGVAYPVESRKIRIVDGQLREITETEVEAAVRAGARAQREIEFFTKLGQARGYKHPKAWAEHVVSGRYRKREGT